MKKYQHVFKKRGRGYMGQQTCAASMSLGSVCQISTF